MTKASVEKIKLPYAGRADIINIFKLIHERKEPTPISEQKLKTLNIGSPKHIIAMLKTFEFLKDNTLNSSTNDLRGTPEKFKNCLEEKVKVVYGDLFNTVKDALNTEKESEARNYFRNHFTNVKSSMLAMITNCFLALRDIININGNFELLESKQKKLTKEVSMKPKEKVNKTKPILPKDDVLREPHHRDIKLILNLNINLDPSASKEAIEELFRNVSLAHSSVFSENK